VCGANIGDVTTYLPGIQAEIHPWSRDGFLPILTSCDVSLLSHFGDPSDWRKSGHKMITSIGHGIPAIVSNTPDYSRVAEFAGVKQYVFSNSDELESILSTCLSSQARMDYIKRAQPVLMSRYYPGSFADTALKLLDKTCHHNSKSIRIYQSIVGSPGKRHIRKIYTEIGKLYWSRMQK
jgi:hypothetical protein